MVAVDKGDVFEPVATVGVFSPSEYFVEVFFAEDDAVIAQLKEEFFVAWCAVEFAEFVEDGAGELEFVFGEPVFEDFFAAFLQFAVITSQDGLYFSAGFGGGNEVDPRGVYVL